MTMNSMIVHLANPPPVERSPRAVMFRARMVLVSIALVAAVLLIAVASWPLKLLVVLAFVRGLFAADIVAFRHAPRAKPAGHLTTAAGLDCTAASGQASSVVHNDTPWPARSSWASHGIGVASHTDAEYSGTALNASRSDAWRDARSSTVGVDLSGEDDDRNAGSWP
jgi:hypothetical protein